MDRGAEYEWLRRVENRTRQFLRLAALENCPEVVLQNAVELIQKALDQLATLRMEEDLRDVP